MTTPRARSDAPSSSSEVQARRTGSSVRSRRLSTETKASFKTTELWMYLLAVGGVLLASYLVDSSDGHGDYFRADQAWLYIVILTIGYLGSRGLAKSGSRDHYDEDR
jgi:hypothetical protein